MKKSINLFNYGDAVYFVIMNRILNLATFSLEKSFGNIVLH